MKLHRLVLSAAKLNGVPASERALLIVVAHAVNEINVLNKLLLLCSAFDVEPKWRAHAHACQALVLARALTGKLNEAWEALQRGYFRSQLSRVYDSRLDEEATSGLSFLKTYFSRSNVVGIIRNKFAFHYSLDHANSEVPEDVPPEELAIYFGERPTATCSSSSRSTRWAGR